MTQKNLLELESALKTLQSELDNREQQIALFKEVVHAVRERMDLDAIFQMVSIFAFSLIRAETVLIPVLDTNCQTYTYRAGFGRHADEIVGESMDLHMGICGWVWKHKRPWWRGVLQELSDEERNQWEKEVGSVILVPLVGRNHFLGGIAGINKQGGGDFDQNDLDLLTLLASQIATAIDNNSLLEQLELANQALSSEKEKAQVTLSSIGDAVVTTDVGGRIEYLNPIAEQLFDVHLAQVKSYPLSALGTLFFEKTREPVADLLTQSLEHGHLSERTGKLILMRPGRSELYVEPNAAPILDPQGRAKGIVLVFRDVSQAQELIQQLSYQAAHDALTGLYNRREFEQRLNQTIGELQSHGGEHSLLYIDLDQFKVVNDTCGHSAGDELLKRYSADLLGMLRQGDLLARIGGDEFGVLLANCQNLRALEVANEIQEMTQRFRFVWEDRIFTIGASIGLISLGRQSESATHILSRVDAACHMAKEAGRNRIYIHDEMDQALHERHDEMEWMPRISKALEERRFELHYQTIMHRDAPGDLCSHYEILIRLRDESGKLIAPGAFLPAAERYNLIATIDRWVVTDYFRWLAEHPAHLQQLGLGSVNLSGNSLSDDHCLRHIENQLREFAIPPEKVCFEITETEAIANHTKAIHFINRLKHLGCKFALDDFGSGFSSYAYLKNLPVDFLKIDGMFVKDVATDPANYAMVESINHIGHVMGRQTIAEFVEDEPIRNTLLSLGVDYMQGYGIAKPRSLRELG